MAKLFLWLFSSLPLLAAEVRERKFFLNGVDITRTYSQDLKGVDVHIDQIGDVYIRAPHYRVYEEDHYKPLSKYKSLETITTPKHLPPRPMEKPGTKVEPEPEKPADAKAAE